MVKQQPAYLCRVICSSKLDGTADDCWIESRAHVGFKVKCSSLSSVESSALIRSIRAIRVLFLSLNQNNLIDY